MPRTSAVYRPRKPHEQTYYRFVEEHFETPGQIYDEHFARQYSFLRHYVQQVIYRYLDCGILDNGFARARRGECGRRMRIIAFIEDTVNQYIVPWRKTTTNINMVLQTSMRM